MFENIAFFAGVTAFIKTAGIVLAIANAQNLPTVPAVDLNRYKGTWYEIARLPNRFEKACVRDVTAIYSPRSDGKIDVVNICRTKNDEMKRSKGTAKVVANSGNAKLKVTFFWPFSGDYWVLELGPDYEYAVVGEPSRKYLWILSRTPQLEEDLYQKILSRMSARGFDTTKVIRTPQGKKGTT